MKRRRPAHFDQLAPPAEAEPASAADAEQSPAATAAPAGGAGPAAPAPGPHGASRALRSFVVEVSAGRRTGAAEVATDEVLAHGTAAPPSAAPEPREVTDANNQPPFAGQAAAAAAGLLASREPTAGAAVATAEAVDAEPGAAPTGASPPASTPTVPSVTPTAAPQRRLDRPHQGTARENDAKPEPRTAVEPRRSGDARSVERQAVRTAVAPAQQRAAAASAEAAVNVERRAADREHLAEERPAAPLRRRLPSWALSLLAHVGLLAALSLTTLASLAPQPDFTLLASSGPPEVVEDFADFELTEESLLDELPDAAAPQAIDPGAESAAPLGAMTPLDGPGLDALGSVGAGPFGSPLGGSGDALTPFGSGLGEAAVASFFGMRIEGRRICFVLDNSGSMQGGRLETVIAELNRSLAALQPNQSFYVLFYSDDVYPLFFPEAADDFTNASPAACEAVRAWLDTVELCYGDVVDEALAVAWSLEPDVVYLLSDGKIQSERDLALLLAPGKPFTIHTVGVGLGSGPTMRERLQNIAAANGGEFREAEVADQQRQLALQRPRLYHRTEPGVAWGRRVRPPR